MRFLTWYLVLAECLVFFTGAQEQHDACSSVEPMQDFQMSRFLGKWHAIQDTLMDGNCITYTYREAQEPREYKFVVKQYISQAHGPPYLSIDRLILIVSEPSTPGRMETEHSVKVSPHGGYRTENVSHVVFMTDYDTYAGVVNYLPNINEHRATILSRTNTLDQMHVDKIRQKLSQCGFDLSNLEIIEHSECPRRRF